MSLEMKECCEKCLADLEWNSEAYICSFECTFCAACAAEMYMGCPNCAGELVRRPTRDQRHAESH